MSVVMEPGPTEVGHGGRCNALRRDGSGKRCRKGAGAGTDHPGVGACVLHLGNTRTHRERARRMLAEQAVAASFREVEVLPVGDPLDAMADLAAKVVAYEGHLASLVGQLDQLTVETMFGPQANVLVGMWERSLLMAQKFLADWVRLGFEERKVRVDEIRAGLVAVFVTGVLRALGHDPETPAVLDVIDLWLPVLDGQPAPVLEEGA